MTTKHTPGPWAFAKYSNKRFGVGVKGDQAFFLLQCIDCDADHPAAIANARLIAAAPDLLAALEWIHPRNGTWRTPDDATAEWIEVVIAKAKGEL